MGQYFGDLWIPFVGTFSIDDAERNTKIIKHVDSEVQPHIAEFPNPVKTLNMAGTVIPVSTSDKTADDYIEDIQALTKRPSIDNYVVDFCGRSGFLSVASVRSPKNADNPISRDYTVKGNFLPMRSYQPTLKVNPKVMPNDFGFELDSDSVDCYVAIPIGAVYSGGDAYTVNFPTTDGTQTLCKVTTNNKVLYDYPSTLVNAGEVKVFDTRGEALEADWFHVYNLDHEFIGDIVISNNFYRVTIDTSSDTVELEFYLSGTWYSMITVSCGSIMYPRFIGLNMEEVYVRLNADFSLKVTRGLPVMMDTGDETLVSSTSVLSGSTTTDNYILYDDTGNGDYYICSNRSFSISGTDLGTGKKWFFRVTAGPELYAHMVMVERNLTRYLGDR